jgi:hypothetical protein
VGEVVQLPAGSSFTVKLSCVVPAKDWQGHPNQLDAVELIAVTPQSARIVATLPLDKNGVIPATSLEVPAEGIVIRARGRRDMQVGPNLRFYTNSIRIQSSGCTP